jgi:hypothetical protein
MPGLHLRLSQENLAAAAKTPRAGLPIKSAWCSAANPAAAMQESAPRFDRSISDIADNIP